jgi:hypothetical protein
MSAQLPLWLQYIQALAVPFLAAVGAWIALQQMQIARVKLRHDLYDRRFAVFQAARKLLAEVLTHARVSDDQFRAYVIGTSDAVFLLDDEISTYLEEIRKVAGRLETINSVINPLPVGEQRSALADEEARITLWLTAQLPDGLVAKFKPFLTLDKQKRTKRRSWFKGRGGFLHLVGRRRVRNRRKVV